MPEDIYLLLGSNEGDRDGNIAKARGLISHLAGKVLEVSSIYETAAWGKTDQAAFLNQAISISSELSPLALLNELKAIEKQVGRISTEKWGPRMIDIDILFYGPQIIQVPELQVPHPYLPVRRFALLRLKEISETFMHPVLKKSITQLLAECPDTSDVKLFNYNQ
jgi:2-amino-4-hydroxy-6-hydroxymethyldihydropteridine diphosphokinase